MSRISVDRANAGEHIDRIRSTAGEFTSTSSSGMSLASSRNTLPALEDGNASFVGSQETLMRIAGLLDDTASNLETIVGNITSIDQRQASNFESSGGVASR